MPAPSLFDSLVVPARFVFLLWLFYTLEFYYGWDVTLLGIFPRTLPGLIGIFTSPLIHGNLTHLISNSFPLLMLGWILYYFYPAMAASVFYRSYLATNLLVWLFAWPGHIHIGASGIVYSMASFLITFGLFKRNFKSLLISLVVFLIYGGIFYGVLPADPRISWESHLAGSLVGLGSALTLSASKKS
jgi:membrane associated rhomboid family serine protease